MYTRHAGWIYRLERLPWPSMRERYASYEYCQTDNATARQRAWLHLQTKPDVTYSAQAGTWRSLTNQTILTSF